MVEGGVRGVVCIECLLSEFWDILSLFPENAYSMLCLLTANSGEAVKRAFYCCPFLGR